ncbi:MAG: VOC family protein [Candidatus Thorarchaeota archaeon]|nr:VOC family protein [Candidatus Thorarchaeota archaeon]
MILGIDVVYLHVFDSETLGIWYSEVLGLGLKFKTFNHGWQEYDFGKSPPTRFAIEAIGMPISKVEKQPIMISFRVDDVKAAVIDLEKKGVIFFSKPKIQKEGFSLFVTLQDPAGNWLQLSQRVEE